MFWILITILAMLCLASAGFGVICLGDPEGRGGTPALISFGISLVVLIGIVALFAYHPAGG